MSNEIKVEVPDIGDFKNVGIIEVLVKAGDTVSKEQSLITLESDKASIEIPSPEAGKVKQLLVKVGDKVSKGSPILVLESDGARPAAKPASAQAPKASAQAAPQTAKPAPMPASAAGIKADIVTQVVVLGSGPGGYSAAFRAADLEKQVVLIERFADLGGVCLNVGCIPSKALLHSALIIKEAEAMAEHGVTFGKPQIDLKKLLGWKESVVKKHTSGLVGMTKQRKVQVVHGVGKFISPYHIEVEGPDGKKIVQFENAIIAAGSQPTKIPDFPHDDPRVMDSTDALLLEEAPKRMLIVGGGIIGLEMAMVYDAVGTKITIVELMDGLIPGCDRDLVKPLEKIISKRYEKIYVGTKVTKMEALKQGIKVSFEGKDAPASDTFDRVLVAVGRVPNGNKIGADKAGVQVNERGFIPVDKQLRTNVPHIFAIGDIVGQPMLAHKAVHEAKVAAEVIAGHKAFFDARTIPAVAYTDPEVAWMGLTETQAQKDGIDYDKAVIPWIASGRASSIGRNEGQTKLLYDKKTKRILGAGIVGPNAGELIAEAVLALEMGADMEDISLTIHSHPTLSETVGLAAEMAEGTITDLLPKKKR
ncbi:MAG TPA: dihydrolipoyl dehydrogenase [Gammaproteobacteria bacterium]|nr:dihydrolipoyl dehydrogenase [Gammaproteobacteria bacterium]